MIVHRTNALNASRPPVARRTRPYSGYSAYDRTTAQRIGDTNELRSRAARTSVPSISEIGQADWPEIPSGAPPRLSHSDG